MTNIFQLVAMSTLLGLTPYLPLAANETGSAIAVRQEKPAMAQADVAEESNIKQILTKQAERWNAKDIEGFMGTYWKSEQLTFSAGGKITRGWQATLNRYKKNYPPEKMGKLTFDSLETTLLNESAALVLGQWHLQFNEKNEKTGKLRADGNFSLVLRKLDGGWKIVHDHSSTLE